MRMSTVPGGVGVTVNIGCCRRTNRTSSIFNRVLDGLADMIVSGILVFGSASHDLMA